MINRLIGALGLPPAAPRITDTAEVKRLYQHWRMRTLYSMVIGYAIFYFCRKNLSIANPVIREELGMSATEMGLVLAVHSIVYGVSKFLSGIVADRANARYFMAIGLLASATLNVFFGLSSVLWFFVIFWALNGVFQASGVPPCSRMLTAWFSKKESGLYWGLWNASHQIGGFGISVLAGFLTANYGWRSAFVVPAIIAGITALFLMERLRDRPAALGLPPINEYRGEAPSEKSKADDAELSLSDLLLHHVLNNRVVWLVCFANFFVYVVRIGFLDWGTSYLSELGVEGYTAGWIVGLFEITGLFGALAAGLISDHLTGGRRGPVSMIYMTGLIGTLLLFWLFPGAGVWYLALLFGLVGVFVYGPQMLVAVVAAQAVPKGAGTAVGLTGLFGCLGAFACSLITGYLLDNFGKEAVIEFYLASAIIGTLLFALTLGSERKS